MSLDLSSYSDADLLQLVSWLEDVGCTDIVDDEAVDWFDRSQKQMQARRDQARGITQQQGGGKQAPQARINPKVQQLQEKIKRAKQDATKAEDLEALQEAYQNFKGWNLPKLASNFMMGVGTTEKPEALILLESPGEIEEATGEPFKGPDASLMRNILKAIDLKEDQCRLAYFLPYRPPGGASGKAIRPEWMDIATPFFQKQLSLIEPKTIICFSTGCASILLRQEKALSFSRLRVKQHLFSHEKTMVSEEKQPIPLLPLPTLSSLMATPNQKRQVWRDLLKFRSRHTEA